MRKRLTLILRSEQGFTLLEIVVALAIGTLIMIMVHTAHKSVLSSIRSVSATSQFYENINLAVRRISRDIECGMMRPDNKYITFKSESNIAPPKKGSISFVTVNRTELAVSGDLRSEYRETDVKSVQYKLRPDKKFPGLFFLMRAEKNLYDIREEDDTSAALPQYESMLLENVTDIEFDFPSGNDWSPKWENPLTFPPAVRVTLKVKDFNAKNQVFTFTVISAATRKDIK